MSWSDRITPAEYITPSGKLFEFAYSESFDKSFSHKTGEFQFSDLRGTYLQDLDITSDRYSVRCHIAGPDYDKDADDFEEGLKEKGHGFLLHPVYGTKNVQVVSVRRRDDPQTRGGIATFEIEFAETIELQPSQTTEYNVETAGDDIEEMNFQAALEFAENIINDTQNKITEIKATIRSKINLAKDIMAKVAFLTEETANLFTSGVDDMLTNLDTIIEEPFNFAQQMQRVFQAPILATQARLTRLDAYVQMLNTMLEIDGTGKSLLENKTPNDITKNDIIIAEVFSSAAMSSIIYSSSLSIYQNRKEAFETTDLIKTNFDLMTNTLDKLQANFTGKLLFDQYFSQSQSYFATNTFLLNVIADIQKRALELKIEKRIELKKSTHYLSLCAEYYNSISNETLEFFETTNNMTGDDFFILKKGREVILYL
jgi:hypothetical protein